MEITKPLMSDLDDIMQIIADARAYMAGFNIDQWQDGYPEREVIERDIELSQAYVLKIDGKICGVMAIQQGIEPFYATIDGEWLSNGEPYATIHRIAVSSHLRGKGAASKMFDFAEELCKELGINWLRVDTHRGNKTMNKRLLKQGFTKCGNVLYTTIVNGDQVRVAYEKKLK